MALPTTFAHGDGRHLVARLCARHVFHVVDHDDRHDDPERDPTILLYGHVYRHEQRQGKLPASSYRHFPFCSAIFLSWAAFSGAATGLQWGLERVALIHQMMMWSINPIFTAASATSSRPLPAHAAEDCMPGTLPISRPISCAPLQTGRRLRDSLLEARRFLSWLLLVPDGVVVRRGNNEFSGFGAQRSMYHREGRSQWAADCSDGRRSHGARSACGWQQEPTVPERDRDLPPPDRAVIRHSTSYGVGFRYYFDKPNRLCGRRPWPGTLCRVKNRSRHLAAGCLLCSPIADIRSAHL